MEKNLPARPNLDHLRRQAKALLSALGSSDREACSTILKFLPAAEGMSAAQVQQTRFRLADAQSAIARKNGFGSWPQLARHVEQLRALYGPPQTYEYSLPFSLGSGPFGDIRIGLSSTLELWPPQARISAQDRSTRGWQFREW